MINQSRWTDQWTALHIAAMMGQGKIVDMLLNAGADANLVTNEGFSAYRVAKNWHFNKIADKISKSCRKKVKQEKQIEKKVNEMENVSIFKPNNFIVPQTSTPSQKSHGESVVELSDEAAWAMQMKRDLEEAKKKEVRTRNLYMLPRATGHNTRTLWQ